LAGYAGQLPDFVGSDLGDEANELADLLHEAHDVENLYESNPSDEKKRQIAEIAQAGGQFRALANSVKAGYRRKAKNGSNEP
jgi:hypothetical protein